MGYGIKLRVWGDYACFTRPEFKVERVSYDVITPSAARGIIESIYWKPDIKWVIDKIIVMKPICFGNIKLNEIKNKAKQPKGDFSKLNGNDFIMYTTIEDDNRVQRGMRYLKEPEYIIEAHFELTGVKDGSKAVDDCKKHYNMAVRRLRDGQAFRQPCFGLRDFSVNFEYVENDTLHLSPLKGDIDLGYMLYDLVFMKDKDGKSLNNANPVFYRPIMKNGVIDVSECFRASAKGDGVCL